MLSCPARQPGTGVDGDGPIARDLNGELVEVAPGRAAHVITIALEGRAMAGTDETVFRLDERDQAAQVRAHLVDRDHMLIRRRIRVLLRAGVLPHFDNIELAV